MSFHLNEYSLIVMQAEAYHAELAKPSAEDLELEQMCQQLIDRIEERELTADELFGN